MSDDGSGPLKTRSRVAAGVLGVFLSLGGTFMIIGGIVGFPRVWMALLLGLFALGLGLVFIRAAVRGWSPGWPD
jgi:hypothetical protein